MIYTYFLVKQHGEVKLLFGSQNRKQFDQMVAVDMPADHKEAALGDLLQNIDSMDLKDSTIVDKVMILATLIAKYDVMDVIKCAKGGVHAVVMCKALKKGLFKKQNIATNIMTFDGPDDVAGDDAAKSFMTRYINWEKNL